MRTITAVLLLLSAFGVRAEWDLVRKLDKTTLYIDFSTIKKTAIGYRAWFLSSFAKRMDSGTHSVKFLQEFDCSEERYRLLQQRYFREEMGEGDIVVGEGPKFLLESGPFPWDYVIPQSVDDHLLKAVCSRVNSR